LTSDQLAEGGRLVEPTTEYDQQIQAFRREYLEDGAEIKGLYVACRIEAPGRWHFFSFI